MKQKCILNLMMILSLISCSSATKIINNQSNNPTSINDKNNTNNGANNSQNNDNKNNNNDNKNNSNQNQNTNNKTNNSENNNTNNSNNNTNTTTTNTTNNTQNNNNTSNNNSNANHNENVNDKITLYNQHTKDILGNVTVPRHNNSYGLDDKSNLALPKVTIYDTKWKYYEYLENLAGTNNNTNDKIINNEMLVRDKSINYYHSDTAPVLIAEYSDLGLVANDIKKQFPNVIIEQDNIGTETNNHPFLVLQGYYDNNKNGRLDDSQGNQKIKLITKHNSNFEKEIINHQGIINMSFGITNFNVKFGAISPLGEYIDTINGHNELRQNLMYISNLALYPDYNQNRQLKIKSMGNTTDSTRGNWTSNSVMTVIAKASPIMQEMMRSEMIFVKNVATPETLESMKKLNISNPYPNIIYSVDNNGTKIDYYETQRNNVKGDAKAMYLRSASIADNGVLVINPNHNPSYKHDFLQAYLQVGSSFSSPRVAKTASDVKNKFPFLSLNQVKQTILTTATSKGDYLDNHIGWGVLNRNKALNGPADFNAGLILEERFFVGTKDRILDDKGNVYFYANIPNGTYEFSNDIKSGLTGDGYSNKYKIVSAQGTYTKDFSEASYNLKLNDVLESERYYYGNVKQAGLRKDGLGELILSGVQYYNAPTQVLDGTLTLMNDSNSHYQVFNNATLNLKSYKRLNIYNDIINSGNLNIDTSINAKNIIANENSTISINNNSKINANTFISNGKIYVNKKAHNKDNSLPLISANLIDITKTKLENPFLNFELNKTNYDNTYFTTKGFDGNVLTFKPTKLSELNYANLKDVPSYDFNKKSFFIEYLNKSNRYDTYDVSLPEFLLYAKADSKDEALADMFNSNFTNTVTDIINTHNDIKTFTFDTNPNNFNLFKIYNHNTFKNILDNNINESKVKSLKGTMSGIDFKFNNIILGAYYGYYYGNNNNATNKDKIYNTSYHNNIAGIKGTYLLNFNNSLINDMNLTLDASTSLGNIKHNRKYYNNKYNLETKFNITSLSVNVNSKVNLFNSLYNLYAKLQTNLVNVNGSDELISNNDTVDIFKTNIKDTNLIKNSLTYGVSKTFNILGINLITDIKHNINLNPDVIVNTEIGNITYKNKGEDLINNKIDMSIGSKFNLYGVDTSVLGTYDFFNKDFKLNTKFEIKF